MALASWIAGAAVVALSIASAQGQGVPWDRMADAQGLDSAQRGVVEEVLRTAHCYGGCDGTILECLDAGDPFAVRLANFVVRRARANRPVDNILTSITNRKRSAFPTETFDVAVSGLTPSGNAGAPVQVVVFADFECSVCKTTVEALRAIRVAMPDSVCLWFKNYPLSQSERSVPAALAYLAAERQGLGWEMNDMLFERGGDLSDTALEACAATVGLDLEMYRSDIQSPELLQQIRAEKTQGVSCGIQSTPGILVNGKRYRGIKTQTELLDRIEEELWILAESR
jgi:protein-disulfide isomerase